MSKMNMYGSALSSFSYYGSSSRVMSGILRRCSNSSSAPATRFSRTLRIELSLMV